MTRVQEILPIELYVIADMMFKLTQKLLIICPSVLILKYIIIIIIIISTTIIRSNYSIIIATICFHGKVNKLK